MSEKVNHPDHHKGGGIEAILVIEAWGLGFCLGNAVKYICRAGRKEGQEGLSDLRKAAWYLNREVARLEAAEAKAAQAEPPNGATGAVIWSNLSARAEESLYSKVPPLGSVPVCARCRQTLNRCRNWPAGIGWAPGHADPLTSPCQGSGVLITHRMPEAELSAWLGAAAARARLWCAPVFAPFPAGFAVVVEDVQPQSGLLLVRRAEEFQGEGTWPNEPFYALTTELAMPQRGNHGRT